MKRKKLLKLILIIIFFIGIAILLYPIISEYWNSQVQSQAITNYDKILSNIDERDYNIYIKEAEEYNQKLSKLDFPLTQYKKISGYSKLLNIDNNSMMGYITIDKIKVKLPIYHSTSSAILNVAVGHFKGSSLPIGGQSTHSILSAHSGLPSAKLFTNLNKLEIGDIFEITVLNKKLTYQIDNIVIIEPTDISELKIVEEKDYVTLVTCTPYGINTHRLLVRGTRIDTISKKELIVTSEAHKIDKLIVTLIISIPILIILVIYITVKPINKKNEEEEI